MPKLTDMQIRAWIKAGERFEGRSDGNGLYLSYRENYQTPVWRFRYKFAGKARAMMIGSYAELSLSKARETAKELSARVALGYDVAGEKQERKSEALAKMEADKKHRALVSEIVADAAKLSCGESFSVDDLFYPYDGPHAGIVDNLKRFADILCFKHRAEEPYCRRMACIIVSMASYGDLESAAAAYRFFSYSSGDLAAIINNSPATLGARGGRPVNRHKAEACDIAKSKWEQMEYASVNVVATTVKHQLEKKYTDAPSVAAIKKWLNNAGIAPKRSAQ